MAIYWQSPHQFHSAERLYPHPQLTRFGHAGTPVAKDVADMKAGRESQYASQPPTRVA